MAGKPLERWERGLIVATVLFVVLVAGPYAYWAWLNADPVVNIPPAVDTGAAARTAYMNAEAAMHQDQMIDMPNKQPAPLAARDAVLAQNATALALFQQAQALPFRDTPMRSFGTLYPHWSKMRELARLQSFAARVKADHGDYPAAVDHEIDTISMGSRLGTGGPLIGLLVGLAYEAIGRKSLWTDLTHLNAAQARQATNRLLATAALHPNYADVLQEEDWGMQSDLLEVFRQPNWRKTFANADGAGTSNPAQTARLYLLNKREAMTNYTRYMDAAIALSKQPYSARHGQSIPIPTDPICRMLAPTFDMARFKYDENRTYDALLTAMMALQAYKMDHGGYPATLGQLIPGYLPAVPADVFADGKPLHYRRTNTGYCLYSIGPDGKDDGGTPSQDGRPKPPGILLHPITDASRGDIVAGVNVH